MINEQELNISNKSYTKKDFYQIYPEILDIAKKISERWDPSSSNESDPGVVLLKLLAFVADKNNYIIDKSILEAFMPSATQEDSMRKLCDMMGYEKKYYESAITEVTFNYYGQKDENGNDKLGEDGTFSINKYSVVSSNDDDINYVLLDEVTLSKQDNVRTVDAIEGTLCPITVGDSNLVKLENLDDLNRFYLPETNIASNGIFITVSGSDVLWKSVKNLNLYPLGNPIFKFGFDSKKQLPYLLFPEDIGDLIGGGLIINYIRTSGVNGNISANKLTKLSSQTSLDTSIDNVYIELGTEEDAKSLGITNSSASKNGCNPESIDDAYNGFKKTIGTFDTLVTCRDYANAIYNLVNPNNNKTPLVSNIQCADIRDHLTRSVNVITYNDYGVTSLDLPIDGNNGTPLINNFDLYLYPLGNYYSYYDDKNYKKSFRPDFTNLSLIEGEIEGYKTLSHNIQIPDAKTGETYCYKAYYDLRARITTTYKVNTLEEANILAHIYDSLYENFNSRKVDWGEEIPFDSILECIENADSRIKNVSLEEPDISLKYMLANGKEEYLINPQALGSTRAEYLKMLAKNILAGKIALFNYNKEFKFDYDQYEGDFYGGENAAEGKKITTLVTTLTVPSNVSSYTLGPNEVVQFLSPSLATDTTYPSYINYYFKLGSGNGEVGTTAVAANLTETSASNLIQFNNIKSSSFNGKVYRKYTGGTYNIGYLVDQDGYKYVETNWNRDILFYYYAPNEFISGEPALGRDAVASHIPANAEYQLLAGDHLYLNYTDSNDVPQYIEYNSEGKIVNGIKDMDTSFSIIKPNFELRDSAQEKAISGSLWKKESDDIVRYWGIQGMFSLDTNQQIESRYLVKTEIDQTILAYWKMNNYDNIIDFKPESEESGNDQWYYILKEGEYFFYTDTNKNGLVILGSGTKILLKGFTDYTAIQNRFKNNSDVDLDKIATDGLAAFNEENWTTIKFYNDESIIFQEMSTITLTEGDILNSLTISSNLSNKWEEIENASYTFSDGTSGSLASLYLPTGNSWLVRSRLDLNIGPNLSQKINRRRDRANHNIIPKIDIIYEDNTSSTISPSFSTQNSYIKSNEPLQTTGGEIDVRIYTIETTIENDELVEVKNYINTFALMNYLKVDPKYTTSESATESFSTGTLDDNYTQINLKDMKDTQLNISIPSNNYGLIMFYYIPGELESGDSPVNLTATNSATLSLFNDDNVWDSYLKAGIQVVKVNKSCRLTINNNDDNEGTIQMSNVSIVNGINSKFLDLNIESGSTEEDELLMFLKYYSDGKFFYNVPIDDSAAIDADKMSDPRALFDYNNVCNKFIISELDADTFKDHITLTKSSRK